MAYKFQLGAFVASGSIKAEDGVNAGTAGVADAGAVAGATSIDGSGDLTMGTITMTGFSVDADGDTALKSLAVDNSSTIGCDADTDIMTLANQSLALANDVDFNVAKTGGLQLGGVAVTSTAAELNLLDGVSGLVKADFTKLAAVDASADELNLLDGITRGSILAGTSAGSAEVVAKTSGQILVGDGTDIASVAVSGDAALAANGALTIANDAIDNNKLANIARGSVKVGGGSNAPTDLDCKTAGQIIVGDGTDVASVAVSGDATLAANGALTIADNAVTLAKMAGLAQGNLILGDAGGNPSALAAGASGRILISDGTSPSYTALAGDATLAANGNVTLAAAQTNVTSIINSSMGKIGTDAAQEYIDFGTSNEIKFAVNNALVATVEAGKFVVAGDLQVNGTTTTIDSTTINISSSFTFEGPADAHETILSCGSPTADATLELFQGAAGTYYMPVFSDSGAKTTVIAATAAEVNTVCDGGNARGTTALADGDGFIHNDNGTMKQTNVVKFFEYVVDKFSGDATVADNGALTIAADAVESGMLNDNVISGQTELASGDAVDADEMLISDGGTLKKIGLDSLKTYMSDIAAVVATKADGDTLIVGVNYFADMSADGEDSVTLPASAGMSVGQSVKIKAPSDCSAARYITINKAGSQTIDGAASIRLESPFAAVELVYVAADLWRVF